MFASSLEPASVRQGLLNCGERIQLGPIFSLIATGRESQLPAGSLTQAKSLVATLRSFEGPWGSLVAFLAPHLAKEEAQLVVLALRYLCVGSDPMWLSCWDLHIFTSNCSRLSHWKKKTGYFFSLTMVIGSQQLLMWAYWDSYSVQWEKADWNQYLRDK